MNNFFARLAATAHTLGVTFRDRVQTAREDAERGDGPVDNAIIISIGVAAAVLVGGLITAAAVKYGNKIK